MLSIKNLEYRTPDGNLIIDDISLDIPEGELLVITGPNGSGKTTLAKLIAGLILPTEGRIFMEGEDITHFDATRRARIGIAFGFQQPVRFKGISVRDLLNIASGQILEDEVVNDLMLQVGLDAGSYVDRDVGARLSGGEIKRIEIASVLARNSKLIIFDEPEAGIDLWSFNNLIEVFETLKVGRNCTVVVISHQERIIKTADRIALIENGRLSLAGSKCEVYPHIVCLGPCCPKHDNIAKRRCSLQ